MAASHSVSSRHSPRPLSLLIPLELLMVTIEGINILNNHNRPGMDAVEVVVVASPFASMAPSYEIDPDADVLLILPPSNKVFAPWDEPTIHGASGVEQHTTVVARSASRPGLRIKVCSRHLTLASRVFRNKLQFGSTRATRQSDGRVHLQFAEGSDPKAVRIVMDAVHGRGSRVPKSIDLNTLAQIALFVDGFQLLDAVEVYAERWISKLEGDLPETYGRDLVLWIYTSHVFRHSDIFRAVTRTAAAQTAGPIRTLGLPIREKIIKHIDSQRQTLVDQALAVLHQALDDLTSGAAGAACPTRHCDSLLLGDLVKSLHRRRLVWPQPARPFAGVSFASVVEAAAGGLDLLRQGRHGGREEVEPAWGPVVNGVGGGVVAAGKEEAWKPAAGWGRVGGDFPATPDASPEPPVFRNVALDDLHDCAARRVVARLDGLERLRDGVQGLQLASALGYQLY